MAGNANQTVLVTGASSGMGRDFALELAKRGYRVFAAARRLDVMEDMKQSGVTPLQMDITKDEDILTVVNTIEAETGGVDVLINNAGFGMYGAVEDTTIEDARYQFEVNLFGLARLTQLVLPYMRKQGSGKVINITSIGGKIYTPLGAWYHATKHALEGWSDCLRLETQSFGIDVVIIEPGAIVTEFGDVMGDPMMERSGNTAYGKLAKGVLKGLRREYDNRGGSDPKVITDLVIKAITARKPKTRYAAGKYAKPLLYMRHHFSDRAFDKVIMSQI